MARLVEDYDERSKEQNRASRSELIRSAAPTGSSRIASTARSAGATPRPLSMHEKAGFAIVSRHDDFYTVRRPL